MNSSSEVLTQRNIEVINFIITFTTILYSYSKHIAYNLLHLLL